SLDARVEVMEAFAVHVRGRQKRVRLLAHDGHQIIDRARAVLALEGGVMAKLPRDVLGLVDHAGTDGAGIHLDESYDVRLLRANEVRDPDENLAVAAQVARAREGKVECRTGAC